MLVYRVEMSRQKFVIQNDYGLDLQPLIEHISTFRLKKDSDKEKEYDAYVCDAFSVQDPILSVLPFKKYVFVFSQQGNKDTSLMYVQEDVRFASFIGSKNVQIGSNNVQTYVGLISDDMLIKGRVLVYDTLRNVIKRMKDVTVPLEVLEYPGHEAAKTSIPYLYTEELDVNVVFKELSSMQKQRFPLRRTWVFDTFIACKDGKGFEQEIFDFVTQEKLRDVFPHNNFYAMFFEMHQVTKVYLSRYNGYYARRSDLPILEQFSTEHKSYTNVPGMLQGTTFRTRAEHIDGIPIIDGFVFILAGQENVHENGTYKVEGGSLVRQSRPISKAAKHVCYGNDAATNQRDCESSFDSFGKRNKQGVWEKPCVSHEDCPFFQANKRYPNYRGGCGDGGYCEFPVGLVRTSYKTYDKTDNASKPVCHGCPLKNPSCCDAKNQDYAFELDIHERAAYGLKSGGT